VDPSYELVVVVAAVSNITMRRSIRNHEKDNTTESCVVKYKKQQQNIKIRKKDLESPTLCVDTTEG
jgi:hypothetical protein